jgi:hypothetical protein
VRIGLAHSHHVFAMSRDAFRTTRRDVLWQRDMMSLLSIQILGP